MRNRDCLGLVVAGLLTAGLAGGCNVHQAYPGPRRPADQVAMIHALEHSVDANGKYPGLYNTGIDKIDGNEIGSGKTHVEVLPGRHTVGLSYVRRIPWYVDTITRMVVINMNTPTPRQVSFDAAAGRQYVVIKVLCADAECTRGGPWGKKKHCRVFVEDAATGSTVAEQFYVYDPNRPMEAWGRDYGWWPRESAGAVPNER